MLARAYWYYEYAYRELKIEARGVIARKFFRTSDQFVFVNRRCYIQRMHESHKISISTFLFTSIFNSMMRRSSPVEPSSGYHEGNLDRDAAGLLATSVMV